MRKARLKNRTNYNEFVALKHGGLERTIETIEKTLVGASPPEPLSLPTGDSTAIVPEEL